LRDLILLQDIGKLGRLILDLLLLGVLKHLISEVQVLASEFKTHSPHLIGEPKLLFSQSGALLSYSFT
jgi:hypothetical protein